MEWGTNVTKRQQLTEITHWNIVQLHPYPFSSGFERDGNLNLNASKNVFNESEIIIIY